LLLRTVALLRNPQACDQVITNQLELPKVKGASVCPCAGRPEALVDLAYDRAQLPFERRDLGA
jgi:hypothetical protein